MFEQHPEADLLYKKYPLLMLRYQPPSNTPAKAPASVQIIRDMLNKYRETVYANRSVAFMKNQLPMDQVEVEPSIEELKACWDPKAFGPWTAAVERVAAGATKQVRLCRTVFLSGGSHG